MRDEEYSVRVLTDHSHRRGGKEVESNKRYDASRDDRGQQSLEDNAEMDEIVKIERGMQAEQHENDSTKHPVPTVDLLMRRAEDKGNRVQKPQSHKVVDRKLGGGDYAKPLRDVEVI